MSEATAGSGLTIALVHGAFADSSSWNGVIELLNRANVQLTAPVNPLRGISIDSAYVASRLQQIEGPVLLVAHSYGGAVITNAATRAPNVVGLVYVCAFAPEEGELLQDVAQRTTESLVGPALRPLQYPAGADGATIPEFIVDPAQVHTVFAADLTEEQAALLAATQRPLSALAFSEPNGVPAWKSLPSWAVVGTKDKTIGGDLVRSMAQRAGATITEVEGSHVVMISKPQAVFDVIMTAAGAVTRS
jgi:pimeloyl-ACP methyl ester carboxylesterase